MNNQLYARYLRYLIDVDGRHDPRYAAATFGSNVDPTWFYDYDGRNGKYVKDTAAYYVYEFLLGFYERYGHAPTDEILMENLEGRSSLELGDKSAIDRLLTSVRQFDANPAEFDYLSDQLRREFARKRGLHYARKFTEALGDDPEAAMAKLQENLLSLQRRMSRDQSVNTLSMSLPDMMRHYHERLESGETMNQGSFPYPYPDWNTKLGGAKRGEVVVFAADYNVGKSFLVHDIAYSWMEAGYRGAAAELEMLNDQLKDRYLARITRLPTRKIAEHSDKKNPILNADERTILGDAMKEIADAGENNRLVFLSARDCATPEIMRRSIVRAFGKDAPDFIVVDYLTQMRSSGSHRSDAWLEVQNVIVELKAIALELGCVILTMIHLNKQGETQYQSVSQRADMVVKMTVDEDQPYEAPSNLGDDWVGKPALVKCHVERNRNGPRHVDMYVEMEFATSQVTPYQKFGNTAISNSVMAPGFTGAPNYNDEAEA